MKKIQDYLNEAKTEYALYHNSYTDAIDAGLMYAEKKGYETDKEELATIVGINSSRPKDGKTTRVNIPLYKAGKKQRKILYIQVYNRGVNSNTFELNTYIQ